MTSHVPAEFCSAVLRKFTLTLCLGFCTLGLVSASAQHHKHLSITTFDVPAAGTSANQGTVVAAINQRGEISGFYVDANNFYHGFLRSPEGAITTFDAPHAGAIGTLAVGLNRQGTIVGQYTDRYCSYHGFLRRPDGTFTTFTNPDSFESKGENGSCVGTGLFDINLFGVIAGGYFDKNFVSHTFVLYPNGTFTNFSAPGAGDVPGSYGGTFAASFLGGPQSINDFGAFTGFYVDSNNVSHGFLRYLDGTIIPFEAPGAGTEPLTQGCPWTCQGTYPASINDFGAMTGWYLDSNNVYHGFLRRGNGRFTDFDAPGADLTPGDFNGTVPQNLNDFGEITGYYTDASNVNHGFLRSRDGKFTKLDAPGAVHGTIPVSNNLRGTITGFYYDARNVIHGFVAVPCDHWCFENDEAATASTPVSPATTIDKVNPTFPGALNQKLGLMPWYRRFAPQPPQ